MRAAAKRVDLVRTEIYKPVFLFILVYFFY